MEVMAASETPTRILYIGLYSGAATGRFGRLLYKTLLREAMHRGLAVGTAVQSIAGVWLGRRFRSIEGEISSNELPLQLSFVDTSDSNASSIDAFLPYAVRAVQNRGMVVVKSAMGWQRFNRRGQKSAVPTPHVNGEGREGLPSTRGEHIRSIPGLEVQVTTLEGAVHRGLPLYQSVSEFFAKHQVGWVTATRGVAGFNHEGRVYRSQWWKRGNVPVQVLAIDTEERLGPLVHPLVDLVGNEGTVITQSVTLYRLD
jgi:PII-like signaling protein